MKKNTPTFRPNLNEHLNKARVKHHLVKPMETTELDPITAAAIIAEIRLNPPRKPLNISVTNNLESQTLCAPPEESMKANEDLLSVMTKRLRNLEEKLSKQKNLIQTQEKEIFRLKNRNENTDQIKKENAILHEQNSRLLEDLQNTRKGLQAKLCVLEYENSLTPDEATKVMQNTQKYSPSNSFTFQDKAAFDWNATINVPDYENRPFDIQRIIHNVNELNLSCGPEMKVERTSNGQNIHKFVERKVINIVFYSDGLCLNDGPFRPYDWPAGQAVVQDLLDGYFPYEFKQNYPEGIPMKIIDNTHLECPRPEKEVVNKINNFDTCERVGHEVISKSTFLNRLPKTIIRDGKIIQVREDIASQYLNSEKNTPCEILDIDITTSDHDKSSILVKNEASLNRIAYIQIKYTKPDTREDMKVLKVQMYDNQTIKVLRSVVKKQLMNSVTSSTNLPDFDLLTTFPSSVLNDDNVFVKDAGLVPTATLHLKWL